MLLPINEVPATVTPIDDAINIKYIGNDLVSAANASGEILPAKKLSTKLQKVIKSEPVLAGIVTFLRRDQIGSLVNLIDLDKIILT